MYMGKRVFIVLFALFLYGISAFLSPTNAKCYPYRVINQWAPLAPVFDRAHS